MSCCCACHKKVADTAPSSVPISEIPWLEINGIVDHRVRIKYAESFPIDNRCWIKTEDWTFTRDGDQLVQLDRFGKRGQLKSSCRRIVLEHDDVVFYNDKLKFHLSPIKSKTYLASGYFYKLEKDCWDFAGEVKLMHAFV